MPTKGLDYSGFVAYALGNDGRLHPVDLSQTVTLSVDDADKYTWSVGTGGMSFTLETKTTYVMLKPFHSWREVKRCIRKMEKERRKRLKEAAEGE